MLPNYDTKFHVHVSTEKTIDQLHHDDKNVPGVYEVIFAEPLTPDGKIAEQIVLDAFHDKIGVSLLEHFSITVTNNMNEDLSPFSAGEIYDYDYVKAEIVSLINVPLDYVRKADKTLLLSTMNLNEWADHIPFVVIDLTPEHIETIQKAAQHCRDNDYSEISIVEFGISTRKEEIDGHYFEEHNLTSSSKCHAFLKEAFDEKYDFSHEMPYLIVSKDHFRLEILPKHSNESFMCRTPEIKISALMKDFRFLVAQRNEKNEFDGPILISR